MPALSSLQPAWTAPENGRAFGRPLPRPLVPLAGRRTQGGSSDDLVARPGVVETQCQHWTGADGLRGVGQRFVRHDLVQPSAHSPPAMFRNRPSAIPSGISQTPGRRTAPATVTSIEPGSASVPRARRHATAGARCVAAVDWSHGPYKRVAVGCRSRWIGPPRGSGRAGTAVLSATGGCRARS